MAIYSVLLGLVGVVAVFAVLCVLEVFLSRVASVWPSFILPLLTFLLSLLVPLNVAAGENGPGAVAVLVSLLVANIPTIVLLFIRYAARENLRRKKQIDRMTIQDLH